mgnify:CR=1 FL=1
MNWQAILQQQWALDVPDARRVQRARDTVLSTIQDDGQIGATHAFTANYRHTVEIGDNGCGGYAAVCTCQDFTGRQMAIGAACKHLVATAMWLEDRGWDTDDLFGTGGTPQSAPLPDPPGWPVNALRGAVGKAIGALADRIGAYLMDGDSPLLIGPTGVGKTSAVHQVATTLGMGLEEVAGSDSWTEADLIGTWTPAREWAWGPVGRAFRRAREGEGVLVFVDEATRFNPRALDLLLRAIQPVSDTLARRMGISIPPGTGDVYVTEAPLLGHRDWCPASHLTWIAAGNPGVNPLDPALVRRFLVLEARLARAVLDVLPVETQPLVAQLWDSYERGELPLPLEYQQLLRAHSPADLFTLYHARLRALDPIAAEAVARVLDGNGIPIGGAG